MVTVIERDKRITFGNRDKAVKHYREKEAFALNEKDAIRFRRIRETIEAADCDKISDSYVQKDYIIKAVSGKSGDNHAKLFRLSDKEVIRIVKEYKGAGVWFDITLCDGTFDENNLIVLTEEHIIHKEECYYQQLESVLDDVIWRKGAWA